MELFYRRFGTGPPLVILHGLYGSSDNWLTIGKALSDSYSVILPDLRNHGNSSHHEIHDYPSMSSDLYELAKRLNLKKFSLAGHSMGGKTAMMFALSHPEMLECLVVMDIAPFTGKIRYDNAFSYHLGILNAVIETDISSASRREEVEIKLAGRIADVKVRGFIMKNLNRDESKKFKWKINTEALLKNLDKIVADLPYKYYSSDETTGFSVVFLKGENSDYIENEDIPEIKKLFPAAELRIIKNAGHWLNSDNPGAVITELKNCY